MSSLTLALLVDAFRPDYLRDAPYIRGLARRGATGRLREPFGFVPRAAYFGGLTPEQSGATHMYWFDPARSPFDAATNLPLDLGTPEECRAMRRFLDDRARSRVPAFARHYVSCLNIPPACLPFLAVAEEYAPWESRLGFRSLFHEMDEQRLPWFWCGWPTSNGLADSSDAGIVDAALRAVTPEHRFAFVHLQELDGWGHLHGPDSPELRARVRYTDGLVAKLLDGLRARVPGLDLVLFGDHGMVTVTRRVNVAAALTRTDLVPGVDYVHFLDSTMVRFWFLTSRAKPEISAVMSDLKGVTLVDDEARHRHRIAGCDRRNGDACYLAAPGVIVSPDFFQAGGAAPKGMHGYDPECEDNQGIFIADGPSIEAGDAGVVDATEIYTWSRRLVGLDAGRPPLACRARPLRFTQHSRAADEAMSSRLDWICDRIEERVGRVEAIALLGSFGRGEGAVVATEDQFVPVNDVELLVVSSTDCAAALATLATELLPEVGTDFFDIGWNAGDWSALPLTMPAFDLKYGSCVLRGDPRVLDRIPEWAPAAMPKVEALMLLLNRSAGLLSGLRVDADGAGLVPSDPRYLSNQITKALVAVGDWYLVGWGAFDSSYRVRARRFADLAPGALVDPTLVERVNVAYRRKLSPDYLGEVMDETPSCARVLVEHVTQAIGDVIDRRATCVRGAAQAYARPVDGLSTDADNSVLRTRPAVARIVRAGSVPAVSLRRVLYAGLPLLARAAFEGPASLDDALDLFEPVFDLPRGDGWSHWDQTRGAIVDAWFAMVH